MPIYAVEITAHNYTFAFYAIYFRIKAFCLQLSVVGPFLCITNCKCNNKNSVTLIYSGTYLPFPYLNPLFVSSSLAVAAPSHETFAAVVFLLPSTLPSLAATFALLAVVDLYLVSKSPSPDAIVSVLL